MMYMYTVCYNPNSASIIYQKSQALAPEALRAQGPKRSTHVNIAWQLVPPHERKHVTKEVLVEPLALPQLLVQLGGNKAVQGLPPAIDALGPSNAGHAAVLSILFYILRAVRLEGHASRKKGGAKNK